MLKVLKIVPPLEIAATPFEKHKKLNCFQISTPKRTFYFSASSEEERKAWVDILLQERSKTVTLDDDDLGRKLSSEGIIPGTPSATTPSAPTAQNS